MNIRMVPIVRAVLIAVAFLFLVVIFHHVLFGQDKVAKSATFNKPILTDAQKLEIRTAQVEMFQAKTVMESTPQFQAFQRAQNHLNETALKVQRESKVDPAKWTLGQDLEYTAVTQPEKK